MALTYRFYTNHSFYLNGLQITENRWVDWFCIQLKLNSNNKSLIIVLRQHDRITTYIALQQAVQPT